jgi:hypothetical protein
MEGIGHTPPTISPDDTQMDPHSYRPDEFMESDPADPSSSIEEPTSSWLRTLGTVKVDGQTIDECFTL